MSNNLEKADLVGPKAFEHVLQQMKDQGHFKAAVLASNDGLPIACAPSPYDADITAAMVALLRTVSKEAREQLCMADMDEVSIFDCDRMRLVSRYLIIDDNELILAVVVPPDHCYRRATNRAVKKIRDLLS